MKVVLAGNWPASLTAGILLLSRSRSFGIPLSVSVVGEPKKLTNVEGPAVVYSHVLASCGVGRDLGQGPLVVVPGPPTESVLLSLEEHGKGTWFSVDSSGEGGHPATKAFVRLVRDNRASARHAAALLRRLCRWAGVPPEPALLDVLFGAPAPPLTRLGLAIRAGQALTGEPVQPITHSLVKGGVECPVIQSEAVDAGEVFKEWRKGALGEVLECFPVSARLSTEDFLDAVSTLIQEGEEELLPLVSALSELAGTLVVLPRGCMMPPLDASADSVANGLAHVLGARGGESNANRSLLDIYRFLGGRFVDHENYPYSLYSAPVPECRQERWQWFVESVLQASEQLDDLWAAVMDPAS